MIQRIGFLLEILSILLCVHALYGKKFCFNINNIIVITMDIILLQSIAEGKLATEMSMLVYPIVLVYCAIEFGMDKRKLIINNLLYIVILSVLQMLIWMVLEMLHITYLGSRVNNLVVNLMIILIIVFIFPHIDLHKLSIFMQQKYFLVRLLLIIAFLYVLYMLLIVKTTDKLFPEHYVVITISLCLLGAVTYMWQKNQYKVREQKMILQMHQLYGEGYQNLITEVRRKQHDFQNHLNTIYSLHYTCSSYEELVRQQEKYMEAIQEENRYSSLLKIGNPVMTGFLYGKFLQAEKREITVIYDVKIGDLECNMPIHKMVEIVGNLFDNEMDAVEENNVEKIIYLYFTELDKTVEFKIKNENEYIPQEKIMKMFKSGESSKGEHRGLGLANVKQICEEHKCDLQVKNDKDDTGKNYIEFNICIRK